MPWTARLPRLLPLIQARAAPQFAGNIDGVDPRLFPPSALITGAMHLAVMDTAKRDHEFIAHFATQRTWLHEAQVVGIGMFPPANQTRLFGNKSQMLFIAMPTRLGNRKKALADTDRGVDLRPDM